MVEHIFYNGTTASQIQNPGRDPAQSIGRKNLSLPALYTYTYTYICLSNKNLCSLVQGRNSRPRRPPRLPSLEQGKQQTLRATLRLLHPRRGPEEQEAWCKMSPMKWVVVKRSVKTAEWLWDTVFSACAGDAPGWKRVPHLDGPREVSGLEMLSLHQVMLAGWGMPIGKSSSVPFCRDHLLLIRATR